MKVATLSSLFFYASILLGNCSLFNLLGQEKFDSTAYYYNTISNPPNTFELENAFRHFQNLKQFHITQKDTLQIISDLRLMAMSQYDSGFIVESEGLLVEALTYSEGLKEDDIRLRDIKLGLYNELAIIYRNSSNFDKAFELYNKALILSPPGVERVTIINNIGNVYKDQYRYEKALENYTSAYKTSLHFNNRAIIARTQRNLGIVQGKLGIREAQYNLEEALRISENETNLKGIYAGNSALANYYMDTGFNSKAHLYANKAYSMAVELNNPEYLKDALSIFLELNEDPKIRAYKKISDSLYMAKQLKTNKFAAMKYDINKEREKTEATKLLQEKEKRQKQQYQFLGILILVFSLSGFLIIRGRHRKNTIKQIYRTETRISKKVHDEVANDVYQLMAKVQGTVHDKEALLDDLEIIYTKTRDISKENSAIEIGADFSEQLRDLLLNYQTDTTAISTRNLATLDWEGIPEIKKTTIYRVLQELMTNMKKYSNASAVLLTFQQNGRNITIEYTDNGIGCTLKNKNGLQNAENRIQAIKGTITFESEPGNGFRSKISI